MRLEIAHDGFWLTSPENIQAANQLAQTAQGLVNLIETCIGRPLTGSEYARPVSENTTNLGKWKFVNPAWPPKLDLKIMGTDLSDKFFDWTKTTSVVYLNLELFRPDEADAFEHMEIVGELSQLEGVDWFKLSEEEASLMAIRIKSKAEQLGLFDDLLIFDCFTPEKESLKFEIMTSTAPVTPRNAHLLSGNTRIEFYHCPAGESAINFKSAENIFIDLIQKDPLRQLKLACWFLEGLKRSKTVEAVDYWQTGEI